MRRAVGAPSHDCDNGCSSESLRCLSGQPITPESACEAQVFLNSDHPRFLSFQSPTISQQYPNHTARMPPDKASLTFLNLPAEVRLLIYRYFASSSFIKIRHDPHLYRSADEDLFHLPRLSSFTASRARITNPSHYQLIVIAEGFSRGGRVMSLLDLSKVCRQIRYEVLPIICSKLLLRVPALRVACWFGLNHPNVARSVQKLIVDAPPDNAGNRVRWMTQLLKFFPELTSLRMFNVPTSKDNHAWGTKWRIDDLRMIKVVTEKTTMQYVLFSRADGSLRFSEMSIEPENPNQEKVDVDEELKHGEKNATARKARHAEKLEKNRKV